MQAQAQPGRLHHNGRMNNAGIIGIIVVQASRLLPHAAKMAAPQRLRVLWHSNSSTLEALLGPNRDPVASCLICTKRVVHTSSLFACLT
ncbi:MAG: hypothetical protein AB1671_08885, partial [Thermodesulfobacteriota bacterium]